jgi:hypothetical protein
MAQVESRDMDKFSRRNLKGTVIVLSILAAASLALDGLLIWQAGSVVGNAVFASLAGIGGFLLMFGATDRMGLSKTTSSWREHITAAGGLLVGMGGAGVAWSAWVAVIEQTMRTN